MTKSKNDLDCYRQWICMIKAGNVGAVFVDIQSKCVDQKTALNCLVAISQVAYANAKRGEQFIGSPYELVNLTEVFCSFITLQEPINLLRYTTSLYHIIYFLFTKNLFGEVARIFKILIKIKQSVPELYCNETKSLHEPYICVMRKCISKETDHLNIISLVDQFLQLLVTNSELSNCALFLQTLLKTCQLLTKRDSKASVRVISTSLCELYKIENIKDIDLCLPELLKIYSCLFTSQLNINCEHRVALSTLESHFNEAKWKFGSDVYYGECFLLLHNGVKLFKWDCLTSVFLRKIQENNDRLEYIKQMPNKLSVKATCELMLVLLTNSYKTIKHNDQTIPQHCLRPFLEMIFKMYVILKNDDKENAIHCLFQAVLLASPTNTSYAVDILKQCGGTILEVVTHMLDILITIRSSSYSGSMYLTKLALVRCSNLLRTYKLATLPEEVLEISIKLCKFMCQLPYEEFEDVVIQQAVETCFSIHVWALGSSQLDKVLECIMVWLIMCPEAVKKAFKLWGDMKHNAVCEGYADYLDITVWTLISERKVLFESEWIPSYMNNEQIGTLLVHELKTYFVNKTLMGRPLLAAASSLLTLDINSFTQVQGIVIAMNITSTSEEFADQCLEYYNKSKSLITKLRKKKTNLDPVDFNSCMGNLLYGQLRCDLRFLRLDCENEILNYTIASAPLQPLVKELPENAPDPNDTCDVGTRYNNICLAKQRKLMEYMDSAIRYWTFAYDMLKVREVGKYDLTVTMILLQEAGYLLRLYSEDIKEAKLWQLLYNLAVLVGDPHMTLCASGETVHTKVDGRTDLLENGKNKLKAEELSDKTKLNFLLNTASYYLYNNQIIEGMGVMHNIDTNTNKSKIQNIQSLITMSQYQALCDLSASNTTFASTDSFHLSLYKALSYLLFLTEDCKWRNFTEVCQLHLQLLDVSKLLGKANWGLEQPRHARYYLKTQLGLAQKLALPLRTVELLLVLAWVDLSTGVVNDCATKLAGLEDLLELCGTPITYGHDIAHPLNKSVLSSPEYLSHPTACCCFHCTSIEYRRLVLETISLRAAFLSIHGEQNDASQCFQVAIIVEENLSKAENPETYQSCALLWLYYTGFMALRGRYQEALDTNRKALRLLFAVKNPILLQHAMEQHVTLQYHQLHFQLTPVGTQINTTCVKKSALDIDLPCGLKTPENVGSPRKVPLRLVSSNSNTDNISPKTPVTLPPRKLLKLPLSGEENTPILVSKKKKQTKTPLKVVSQTPKNNQHSNTTKTPFVIFGDDESSKPYRITRNNKQNENVKILKKDLFLSSPKKTKSKNTMDTVSDNIVRKTNRGNSVKTYSKVHVSNRNIYKLDKAQDSKKNMCQSHNDKKNTFTFSQMKNAIDDLNHSTKDGAEREIHNENYPCNSSTNQINESNVLSIINDCNKSLNDTGCDFVEGTPTESPKETKVTRITRSKRLK